MPIPDILRDRTMYVSLATLVAFVMLTLTTVSAPLLNTLTFLHSTQANGVHFGMWGWCLDDKEACSTIQFGYNWQPEITHSITKAFVLYPIAVVFTFFALAATLPLVFARSRRADQVFFALAWAAFGTSALAFLFMIGICGTAKARFERHGFGARYGNLTWLSLAATLLLFVVSLSPYYIGAPPKSNRQSSDSEAGRSVRRWSRRGSKQLH